MKALVYTQPNLVAYRDESDPSSGAGEAIVRVDAVGICGSDMHAYLGHDPRRVPPLILGHEATGQVVAGTNRGARVVINPLSTCGVCDVCLGGRPNLCSQRKLIGMNRPGAFAELIAIPENNLIPIPDDMDAVHAALTEPAATALHAIVLAARAAHRPLSEANALVLGGGSVGLFAALLLRNEGCRSVSLGETNALRRRTAQAAGSAEVFDPTDASVDEDCFDLVVDAVGAKTTRALAVSAVRPGGIIMHIGLTDKTGELDARKLTLSEITFIGTYTYTPTDLRAALAKLHNGALGKLDWVEQRPLSEGAEAFEDLINGRAAAPKIVLRP